MLRNIEAALRPAPDENTAMREATALALIATFADNTDRLRDWAIRIPAL
jgi:hypothetical protein